MAGGSPEAAGSSQRVGTVGVRLQARVPQRPHSQGLTQGQPFRTPLYTDPSHSTPPVGTGAAIPH